MYDKENLVKTLTEQLPEFIGYLNAWEEGWVDENAYTILGEFVRYILKVEESEDQVNLSAGFKLINALYENGDPYVKEAIITGFLETLQNNLSWKETSFDCKSLLSDDLKLKWDELNAFGNKK